MWKMFTDTPCTRGVSKAGPRRGEEGNEDGSLGAPAEAYVLAILFGCNLCYATPIGYQTNLLVMSAARYRFADFIRVGAPLLLLMWGALTALLGWRYALW